MKGDGTDVVVQAVHGLGGIGKSALAARYAAIHRRDFDVIWWIISESPAGIDSGLAALATRLRPALAGLSLESLREWALAWLGSHDRWLVVLDNVTEPNHVKALLAQARSGRFLITTRRATGWHGIATSVPLNVLNLAEARQLMVSILTHGSDLGPDGLDDAEVLCADLGCLPLAIEQASAYMTETGITPAHYLQLIAEYPAEMYSQTAEGADEQRTVARIWRVTLDHLATTPTAGKLLRVLAFYASDAIPRSLLKTLASPQQLTTATGRLAAYSMITISGENLAVHRLVQAVARTPDPVDPHRTPTAIEEACSQAVALLEAAAPVTFEDPADWPAWRIVMPHLEALANYAPASTDALAESGLLTRGARFLLDQGAPRRAIPLFRRLLEDRRRVLGEDHPDTLTSRNNLAFAYKMAEDLGRAIPLYEATLAAMVRVLGEDHLDTLTSRDNLASAYQAAGDLGRAMPLYEATLEDRRRVLGEDHPDSLRSRSNLARAYQAAGDLGRAIPLYEATLAAMVRVLGEDHRDTDIARSRLAGAYQDAGDSGRAIPLYEANLADSIQVLGEDHPNTLTSRHNLAFAYDAAGDLGRAIPLYEANLADSIRVLGEDHPDTLASRHNLASAYQDSGDLGRAIPLHEVTVEDRRRVLGEDHPDTLASRNNLAAAYEAAGDLGRAIPLYEAILAESTRVLSEDHPQILIARNNLAGAYESARDLGRAIPLLERCVEDCRRVLGEHHPDTLASRNNLASAYESARDLGRAIPLYEATVADSIRVLGEDHPDTLRYRNNLAYSYVKAGDLGRAIPLYEATLAGCIRVHGENHPVTRTVRKSLRAAHLTKGISAPGAWIIRGLSRRHG